MIKKGGSITLTTFYCVPRMCLKSVAHALLRLADLLGNAVATLLELFLNAAVAVAIAHLTEQTAGFCRGTAEASEAHILAVIIILVVVAVIVPFIIFLALVVVVVVVGVDGNGSLGALLHRLLGEANLVVHLQNLGFPDGFCNVISW